MGPFAGDGIELTVDVELLHKNSQDRLSPGLSGMCQWACLAGGKKRKEGSREFYHIPRLQEEADGDQILPAVIFARKPTLSIR